MTRKETYRRILIRFIWFMILFTCLFSYWYLRGRIPGKLHVITGEEDQFRFSIPLGGTLESDDEEVALGTPSNIPEGAARITGKPVTVGGREAFTLSCSETGSYRMTVKLFGWLPLKEIQVEAVEQKELIPGGEAVGIYLETEGVMVVGTSELTDEQGVVMEPAYGALQSGDYILEADGKETPDKETLIEVISGTEGRACTFKIRREEEILETRVKTVKTEDGSIKAGIWVRDDAQGIGTLTYADQNGRYGVLGHAMSDSDTGKRFEVSGGTLEKANIQDVIRGRSGTPGSLLGTIVYGNGILGTVKKNTEAGVFGSLEADQIPDGEPLPVGFKQDVEPGPAVIRCPADGTVQEYEIEILKADPAASGNKGMVVQVTDERLLQLTGGIVQGMSGSPIIQNGRLVGAVTHVFISDSTKGYGIFLEDMLEEAE